MKAIIATTVFAAGATASAVIRYDLHRRVDVTQGSTTSNGVLDRPLAFNNNWLPYGAYFITIDVGNPPQTLEVQLDSGSSTLWIPSASTANCEAGDCPGGQFNASESSTYALMADAPPKFEISYGDFSSAQGRYSNDTVRVGPAALQGQAFGLASRLGMVNHKGTSRGAAQYGIMGIGPVSREFVERTGFSGSNVPLALKQQGHIGSQSYSVYLDDVEANNGHVVFGGIDTAKYQGELKTLSTDERTGVRVHVTGFSMTYKGQRTQLTAHGFKRSALLDTGAPNLVLPQSVYDRVTEAWADIPRVDNEFATLIPCSYAREDASISIQLAGDNQVTTEIEMPLKSILVPALKLLESGSYNETAPLVINGTEQCVFTASPAPDDTDEFVAGDAFFRSAYAFFNLDENTVSLAQASYNVKESNLVPIRPADGVSIYPKGSGRGTHLAPRTPASCV